MSESTSYMKFYIGDYVRDTGALNAEEHGAYLLLIMHAFGNGGVLPQDEVRLRRITKMTLKQWNRSKGTVMGFFKLVDGTYRHKRVDEELAVAVATSKARRAAGKMSGRARMLRRINEEKVRVGEPTVANFGIPKSAAEREVSASQVSGQVIDIAENHRNKSSVFVPTKPQHILEPEEEKKESFSPSTESLPASPVSWWDRKNSPANGRVQKWNDAAIEPAGPKDANPDRPCVGAFYLDATFDKALDIAGIDPIKSRATWEPVVEWLKAGIEPKQIYRAIEYCAGLADYHPPQNLRRFDKPVRDGWGKRCQ